MKRRIIHILLAASLLLIMGCQQRTGSISESYLETQTEKTTEAAMPDESLSDKADLSDETDTAKQASAANEEEKGSGEETEMRVKITAGEYTVTAELYDNEAGRALWNMLPLTLPMMNLYGREMCYRFGAGGLPAEDAKDQGYEIGDISYWPPAGSLVILYKQNGEVFEQQPIGHTDDNISFFDGMDDTDILFEKAD